MLWICVSMLCRKRFFLMSRSQSQSHTSSGSQLSHVQPPSTPLFPCQPRPPIHGPLSSPLRSNPLLRVSISTLAELEDAVVVSSKGAGGRAGECYGGFRVPRSIHPTLPSCSSSNLPLHRPIQHAPSQYFKLYQPTSLLVWMCSCLLRGDPSTRLIPSFSRGPWITSSQPQSSDVEIRRQNFHHLWSHAGEADHH